MRSLIEKASRADISLVEMEHPSLKNALTFCSGRAPIYAHKFKVEVLLDVGDLSRDGRVTTELGTGSLRHEVGVLFREEFRAVVDSE